MELISSLIRMISIAEFSGDGAEEKAEAMKPCEYKDGHGNLCGKPTNLASRSRQNHLLLPRTQTASSGAGDWKAVQGPAQTQGMTAGPTRCA